MQTKRMTNQKDTKAAYKMKMFNNVGSKVVEGIKKFKTSDGRDNLDNLIQKVENELGELNTQEN